MEMAPVALSVAPALQEAAASGIWMQELSHPLSWDCSAEQVTTPDSLLLTQRAAAALEESLRASRSWCALLMEEHIWGGLQPHETFLWGVVASATPLRGRCGGSAKERIRGRQGLEETRLPQTPAFSPSLLTGSSSHMLISTPRGTACAVSVRAKMRIEGSGRSARRFRALDDIILYRDTINVGKVGIHSVTDLRTTPYFVYLTGIGGLQARGESAFVNWSTNSRNPCEFEINLQLK